MKDNGKPVTEHVLSSAAMDRDRRDWEQQLEKGRAVMEELNRKIAETPDAPGPKPSRKTKSKRRPIIWRR